MQCTYCNRSLTGASAVVQDGKYFCSALHLKLWRVNNSLIGDTQTTPSTRFNVLLTRRTILVLIYAVVAAIVLTEIGAFIAGEIAQQHTDPWRIQSLRLVRDAAHDFRIRYGWLVAVFSMVAATICAIKGWLPGTKTRRPA